MKILFITNANGPDYMSDIIFHGGKSLLKENIYESNKLFYMYDDFENKNKLYGRGFTLYAKIKSYHYSQIPGNVIELISEKFFDKVIYGSIRRCDDYFDFVCEKYKKDNIITIDGEDDDFIDERYIHKSIHFKREYYIKQNYVYPINFGIPKELVLKKINTKVELISNINPNFNRDYTFEFEKDYYEHYSKCWFAITKKKGGWDSLRHYEIMMNGCIPLFKNLENCPELTMTDLPKKELILFNKERKTNLQNNQYILTYTLENLTTEKIFNKIINF